MAIKSSNNLRGNVDNDDVKTINDKEVITSKIIERCKIIDCD